MKFLLKFQCISGLRGFSTNPSFGTKIQLNNTKTKNKILSYDKIPSARRLPIFGTFFDFMAAGAAKELHKYIDMRHNQLGPILRERLGTIEIVFVSSPKLMRSVFLYEGKYPRHPLPEAWTLYDEIHKIQRGLFFMNGAEWLHNRKILNRLLLGEQSSWMTNIIWETTDLLIKDWKTKTIPNQQSFTEIIDLEEQLYRWSINVVISLMLGKHLDIVDMKTKDAIDLFSKNVHKIFYTTSHLMDFPPKIAQFLKLKIWKNFENVVTNILHQGNNLIDLLRPYANDNGLILRMQNCKISSGDIKRIFLDMIIAAGDTTAFSAQWALYLLSRDTKIQNSCRIDIKNSIEFEEVGLTRGIIRETLRLYPVAPFIGRFLAKDAIIGNYQIHKNTLVILSLYTSGRDENTFQNAESFHPHRWLRENHQNENFRLQSLGTLPFAIGGRSCIGKKIALTQMQFLINGVLLNFEMKCLNEVPLDVILRMVAIPNKKVKIALKNINPNKI